MVNQVNGVAAAATAPVAKKMSRPVPGIAVRGPDRVQLSSATLKVRAPGMAETHVAKIARIRDELQRGVYVTPEKFELAVGRALDDAIATAD